MSDVTDLWFSQYVNPSAKCRVICFPHAGGAASFFYKWPNDLTNVLDNMEVCSTCYPGRAGRIEEKQPTDIRTLGNEIAEALLPLSDLPLILFGHSLGAAVALESARKLEERGIVVSHLIASGSRNGPLPEKGTYVEEDDETLCKNLVDMGGTDPNAINDPVFLELVLPAIRADGKMFNAYNMMPKPKLNCPVTTIYGDSDIHADIRPWRDITNGFFSENCVKGDHFYLVDDPPYELIKNIARKLI